MDVLESVIRRESKRSSNRILNEHFRLVTAGLWNTTTNRRFTLEGINIWNGLKNPGLFLQIRACEAETSSVKSTYQRLCGCTLLVMVLQMGVGVRDESSLPPFRAICMKRLDPDARTPSPQIPAVRTEPTSHCGVSGSAASFLFRCLSAKWSRRDQSAWLLTPLPRILCELKWVIAPRKATACVCVC